MDERKIPKKNYFILAVVIIISMILLYYFYICFSVYKDKKNNTMILSKYLTVINYLELEDYLVENPNSIIYVSVLGNDDVRKFEKEFKNDIKLHKINMDILYLNLTEELKDDTKKKEIRKKYSLEYDSILNVPNIAVFENGQLKLVYNISENGYDVEKMEQFLTTIKTNVGDIND